jgi:RNA polymerase sigma-70 factor (ECF subfamily)
MTTTLAIPPTAPSVTATRPRCLLPESQSTASYTQQHTQAMIIATHRAPTGQDISDEALLLEISYGGERAMEVLYERYARYAYALAYRIIHDSSSSEDIVQDVFLSIWRKAASYQKQHGCVRSWLQAIVHHRAIDCIRASAHHEHQYASLEDTSEPAYNYALSSTTPGKRPEVWEEVWHEERSALLRSILTQLPLEQRQVIELGYFGGYTHAEIAKFWHLPLGTVKGRMRLGLQKMKYLLAQHGVDGIG